jgi:enediyne biosynthesis protein E3
MLKRYAILGITRASGVRRLLSDPAKFGFQTPTNEFAPRFNAICASFLQGFEAALRTASISSLHNSLELLPCKIKPFAYEGASMALGILDATSIRRPSSFRNLLEASNEKQIYTMIVGLGWAIARFPMIKRIESLCPTPFLKSLIGDGLGFHQAFFYHRRIPNLPIPSHARDPQVLPGVYRGIGRAIWFISGGNADHLHDLVLKFPVEWHSCIWSGVGLAATFAAGSNDSNLERLRSLASRHHPYLAQGAAFAATALSLSNCAQPFHSMSCENLCGLSIAEATAASESTKPSKQKNADIRHFEQWREELAAIFRAPSHLALQHV